MFSVSKNTSTAVKPTVRLYNKKAIHNELIFVSEVAFISARSYFGLHFSDFEEKIPPAGPYFGLHV